MAETHIAFMARESPAEPPRPLRLRPQPQPQPSLNTSTNTTSSNYQYYHSRNTLDSIPCKYARSGPPSDDGQSISPVSTNLSLIRYLSPVSTFSQRAILHLEQIAAEESLENSRSNTIRGRGKGRGSHRRSTSSRRSASSASSASSKRSRSTSSSTGRRSFSSASSSPSVAGSDILDYYKTALSPSSPTSLTSPTSPSSSCYSRRSSITSIGSDEENDIGRGWYTSADAFSIGDPVALGVFDEDKENDDDPSGTTVMVKMMAPETKMCTSTATTSPISISPAKLNKPLPREPPIALAPLKVRKQRQTSTRRRISAPGNKGLVLRPTLAQAERDLQNALDECASQPSKRTSLRASAGHDVTAVTALLNAPLQISRGGSRMTPSRPAPRPPPTLSYSQRQCLQQQQQYLHEHETLLQQHQVLQRNKNGSRRGRTKTGGIQKMPFHLTVPGLGRKLHLRSFSSSQLREMMSKDEADEDSKNKDEKRPASVGHEREMRSQPRLQTKKDVAGLNGALAAVTAAATASTVSPFTFQVKGSNHSLDSVESRESSESRESREPRESGESGGSMEQPSEPVATTGGPVQPPTEVYDDKIFVACSRMPSYGLPLDQLIKLYNKPNVFELDSTSAATPPIRVDDTDATSSTTTKPQTPPTTLKTKTTPWELPDKAVRSILENAGSLDDLFSMAVTSRQFYRIFKRHELSLIKTAVYQMSPAAWELREMSPPWDSEWQGLLDPDAPVPDYTPTLYLQRYAHDIFTLAQLKSLILARCCSFLRPDTIRGLAGADPDRATAMDDALWRIWTFCRIFGCGKGRENDIAGQMDWMNGGVQAKSPDPMLALSVTEPFGMNNVLFEPPTGFAEGNPEGLSQSQMYDMTELFTCLSVLMQPIHGKCTDARRAGIYNGFDIKVGDNDKEEKHLEEWTAYILTLGLSAVLSLGSICPIKNATATFQKAQSMGLTKWDLADGEITRSSFLKDAVSKTYKSREEAFSSNRSSRSSASSSPSSSRTSLAQSAPNTSTPSITSSNTTASSNASLKRSTTPDQPGQENNRLRRAAFAEELRIQRSKPRINGNHTSFSEERPISSYSFVMNGLEGLVSDRSASSNVPPVPSLPQIHPALRPESLQSQPATPSQPSRQSQPIARSQPAQSPPTRWSSPQSPSSPETPGPGQDPVDRAIDIMVRELGFSDSDAKWALRTTDTGEGVNVNAAVALLIRGGRSGSPSSLSSASSTSSSTTTIGLGLIAPPSQRVGPTQGLGPIREGFV